MIQRRQLMAWGVPALLGALYVGFVLTNGRLDNLLTVKAWGSLLYANIWDHLLHGNFFVDPQYVAGEYFDVGHGHFVAYFGVMPALIRGVAGLFAPDLYSYNFTNISMILAAGLSLGSVWYAVRRLARDQKIALRIGASIVLALLFASPLSYLLVWSWTYHEVILWGLAWALLFVSMYALWLFDRARMTRWQAGLMGLSVGMAMLCRPTIGLTLALPFGYLITRSIIWHAGDRRQKEWQFLWPGLLVCAILALVVIAVNAGRWGSPFTFVRIDRNVQLMTLYPDRREAIQRAGEFNLNRLPTSLYYYLVPSRGNIQSQFPFITPDRDLNTMNRAPQYDYIEGSRVPITFSMPYLLVLAGFGVWCLWRVGRKTRLASLWLLGGATLTFGALATVYALALRYSAECIPGVVFLGLVYVAALEQKIIKPPGRKTIITLAIIGVFSLYATLITTLAYKQFVWDIEPSTRETLRHFLHYVPTSDETKHIINGKRFPVY